MDIKHRVTVHLTKEDVKRLIVEHISKLNLTVNSVNFNIKEGYAGDVRDPGYPTEFLGIDVDCTPCASEEDSR